MSWLGWLIPAAFIATLVWTGLEVFQPEWYLKQKEKVATWLKEL